MSSSDHWFGTSVGFEAATARTRVRLSAEMSSYLDMAVPSDVVRQLLNSFELGGQHHTQVVRNLVTDVVATYGPVGPAELLLVSPEDDVESLWFRVREGGGERHVAASDPEETNVFFGALAEALLASCDGVPWLLAACFYPEGADDDRHAAPATAWVWDLVDTWIWPAPGDGGIVDTSGLAEPGRPLWELPLRLALGDRVGLPHEEGQR